MMPALSTPSNRRRSLVFLAVCAASAIAAAVVGISDNLPGLALAFLAVFAFLLAFAHPWRTSKQFRLLFYGSGCAFLVFGVLHNVLDALAGAMAAGTLPTLINALGVAAFLIAVLFCPPGLLLGAVGAIVMAIWKPTPHTGGTAV